MFQEIRGTFKMTADLYPVIAKAIENAILKNKFYAHFDSQKNYTSIFNKICDPHWVAHKHGFFPFIHVEMIKSKKRQENGKFIYKTRDLYYASHTDSYIYQFYSQKLINFYELYVRENGFENVATAYRSLQGKSNIEFAKEAFDFIKVQKNSYVLLADFKGFFDNLDHNLLKANLRKLLRLQTLPDDYYAIFRNMTRFCYIDLEDVAKFLKVPKKKLQKKGHPKQLLINEQFREFKRAHLKFNQNMRKDEDKEVLVGIPQGSPISAVYANIYMITFDKKMSDFVNEVGGFYRRYSDDILCVVPFENKNEFNKKFLECINEIKIQLSKDKTRRFHVNNGNISEVLFESTEESVKEKKVIDYLGFSYDGSHVLLKSATLSRYYKKLDSRIYLLRDLAKSKGRFIGKKLLFMRYSHLGEAERKRIKDERKLKGIERPVSIRRRNFFSYAYKAEKIMNEKMIRHQVSKHLKHISKLLSSIDIN